MSRLSHGGKPLKLSLRALARVALAVASAALVAVGVGLVYPPAGVITAGVQGFAALYVLAYMEARR